MKDPVILSAAKDLYVKDPVILSAAKDLWQGSENGGHEHARRTAGTDGERREQTGKHKDKHKDKNKGHGQGQGQG